MPKVREYGTPNLDFQAVPQESYAKYEGLGESGRAIREFGQQFTQDSDVIYKRQEQEETSDVNAKFADLSAQTAEEIDQQTRDGTINSEKYTDGLRDKINDIDQNISTAAGRRAFERNSARVQGYALRRSAKGEAAVKGATAVANASGEANSYAAATYSDPKSFDTNRQALEQSLQDQVDSGLDAKAASKLKTDYNNILAQNAIKGFIKINPDLAQQELDSGKYDAYLDGKSRPGLQDAIDARYRHLEIESTRANNMHEKAMKLSEEAFYAKNFDDIEGGAMSVDQVEAAVRQKKIRPEFGQHMIDRLDKVNQRDLKTKPDAYQDVVNRMTDPQAEKPITSFDEVLPLIADGSIAADGPHSAKTLKWLWDSISPEGKAIKTDFTALKNKARAAILYPDVQGGKGNDPHSVDKYNQWLADTSAKLSHAKDNGLTERDFLTYGSKNYLGTDDALKAYAIPLTERYQIHAQDIKGSAGKKEPPAAAKKENESIMQNLMRNGDIK